MNLLDALSGLGTVLDTPGAMVRTALAGENPFASVFDTDKRVSGRDLLERYGLAGKNEDQGWIPDAGDLGWFAAEMVLDPTNLVGGGLLTRLLGKASKAKAANRGIEAANALSREQRAMGFMPEEVAKLTKIADEPGVPRKQYHGTAFVYDRPDPSKWSEASLYGPGHYTTDAPEIASEYTEKGMRDNAVERLMRDPVHRTHSARAQRLWDAANKWNKEFETIEGGISEEAAKGNRWGRLGVAQEMFPSEYERMQRAYALADRARQSRELRRKELIASAPAHVRQEFVDARNPFESARNYPVMDLIDKAPGTILDKYARGRMEQIDDLLREAEEYRQQASRPGQPVSYFNEQARLAEEEANRLLAVKGDDLLDALGSHSAGALRKAGYDAIQHTGGRNTGGAAHNVVIASTHRRSICRTSRKSYKNCNESRVRIRC